jgi:RimJ/RimL family protein N-acetyltransferase
MSALFLNGLPTLETPRLRLRALGAADAAAIWEIFSDYRVTRFWGRPRLERPDQVPELLRSVAEGLHTRTLFQWGIEELGGTSVVGTCTLAGVDPLHQRAELGFALAFEHWGRGIASEAVSAVVAFAFGEMGLHRLIADSDPRNVASARVLEKAGFRREGQFRQHYRLHGEWQDGVLFGLLRSEWEEAGRGSRPA